MPEEVSLRIRHPQGISTINSLTNISTISDLKQQISNLIKSNPTEIVLRVGYPPSPVDATDETNLTDAQISSGDTIIVEVHQLEESKSQARPNNSNQSKSDMSVKPIIHAPQNHSQTATQNGSKGPSVNENNKIDLTSRNEIRPEVERNNRNQGSISAKNDYAGDLALTEEEYDAQLAKALQESMSVENAIPKKEEKVEEEEENLFAELEVQGNKIELPSKGPLDSKAQSKKEENISLDEDIEYARKLQEELYSENDKKFEIPRYQPARQQMDIEYEYEPVDFYDTTKQYNEENNLPEDPPLRNDDFEHPLLGRNEPFGQNRRFGGVDQDDPIQRAIQESLRQSGFGTDFSNEGIDADLQRILERSKNEK